MIFNLKTFLFDRVKKLLVAELSELGLRFWNVGFGAEITIASHLTGREERFICTKVDKDDEGEIQGWWFKPAVVLANVEEVLIIND